MTFLGRTGTYSRPATKRSSPDIETPLEGRHIYWEQFNLSISASFQRKAQRLEKYNIPAAIRDMKKSRAIAQFETITRIARIRLHIIARSISERYISSSTVPLGLLRTPSGSFQRLPNQGEEEWKINHRRKLEIFFLGNETISSRPCSTYLSLPWLPRRMYLSPIFPWLASSRIVELGPN